MMSDSEQIPVMPLFSGFRALLVRDLKLVWRNLSEVLNPLVFFLIATTMIPLGVNPAPSLLADIAPGILWVMALLATLLSLGSLFHNDYQDGSLEQFLLAPQSLYFMVLAKMCVHWLTTGLPLTLLSPLFGIMLALPDGGYIALMSTLFLGTMCLSVIGAIGAALTVCLPSSGLMLSLIVMPLYLPVLILGTITVNNAVAGIPVAQQIALMGAGLAVAILIMPLFVAAALRISSNN